MNTQCGLELSRSSLITSPGSSVSCARNSPNSTARYRTARPLPSHRQVQVKPQLGNGTGWVSRRCSSPRFETLQIFLGASAGWDGTETRRSIWTRLGDLRALGGKETGNHRKPLETGW